MIARVRDFIVGWLVWLYVVILFLACACRAQIILPQIWVDNNEGNVTPDITVTFPSAGSGGAWTCGATNYGPYTANSQASEQQSWKDIEACRTVNNKSVLLILPVGVISGSTGLVIPQTNSALATKWLIVQSAQDASLPDGQIVCGRGIQDNVAGALDIFIENPSCSAPNDAQFMWGTECTANNCTPLTTCSPVASGGQPPQCVSTTLAPDHWLIMDGQVRLSAGSNSNSYLSYIAESGIETSTSQLPSHIHQRKMWVHGDWTSLSAGANQVSAGWKLGCVYCSLVDSQMSQALRPGSEGHAITILEAQQVKIVHNIMEGQASGLFIGGFSNGTGPSISNFVANDIEAGRNRFTFPSAWLGIGSLPNTNTHFTCCPSIGRKNGTEFKEGQRIAFYANVVENVDNSGGQGGPSGPDFTVRNNSAGVGSYYASSITDFYVANNILRNACEGFQLDGRSGASSGGGATQGIQRGWFYNNLHYNLTTKNPGCSTANSVGPSWGAQANKWRGTITRSSNVATMTIACTPDVAGNCPAGPPGTGFAHTNINIGDPSTVSGCTSDTSFNVATHSVSGTQVPISLGPLAIAGTDPNGLTVVWNSTGSNSTDSSGNCQISNVESWPKKFLFTKNTIITDAGHTLSFLNTPNPAGPNFAVQNLLRDNIITGTGIFNNPAGEGTGTETFNFDTASLGLDYSVLPTRTASLYTEYANNPSYPGVLSCAGAGCNPPHTLYFPATPYCSTGIPDATCVGFSGAMSASSLPLTLADYHGFRLNPASVFAAGQAQPASDGGDMGVNLGLIDAAMLSHQFVCNGLCGSGHGPYPDVTAVPIASSLFGLQVQPRSGLGNFPVPLSFGASRLWDTPVDWATLNPSNGSYSWNNLDNELAKLFNQGFHGPLVYTFGVVPTWASSAPTDAGCDFGALGGCDLPSDLNTDGTGTDATFTTFVAAIAAHVNDPTYLLTHAKIGYWESWNEWYRNPVILASFAGCATGSGCSIHASYVQMVRMTEDVRCAITGKGTVNGAACSASAIDANSKVLTPSFKPTDATGAKVGENFLHCDDSPFAGSGCTSGNRGRNAVDILNFHAYTLNAGNVAEGVNTMMGNVRAQVSAADLSLLPVWSDEGGYGQNINITDPDLRAAFVARYYALCVSNGLANCTWYEYDNSAWGTLCVGSPHCTGLNATGLAYSNSYAWTVGNILNQPCAAIGTVYSCGFLTPAGNQLLEVWDTAQSCAGGACTTSNYTTTGPYTQVLRLDGTASAIAGACQLSCTVAIGAKPILLTAGPGPLAPLGLTAVVK